MLHACLLAIPSPCVGHDSVAEMYVTSHARLDDKKKENEKEAVEEVLCAVSFFSMY